MKYTEAQLNGFPERQLPDRFAYTKADDPLAAARDQEEYRLLVGFDQPLLCGMYVDKPPTGVTAVQTLSRLNRIHPLKTQDDVRILDFVNDAEAIQKAFEDWFETTITEEADPNLLYDKQCEVMEFGVLAVSEMEDVPAGARRGRAGPHVQRRREEAAREVARAAEASARPGAELLS